MSNKVVEKRQTRRQAALAAATTNIQSADENSEENKIEGENNNPVNLEGAENSGGTEVGNPQNSAKEQKPQPPPPLNLAMVALLDVGRLRQELKDRGLDWKGPKHELAERLRDAVLLATGKYQNFGEAPKILPKNKIPPAPKILPVAPRILPTSDFVLPPHQQELNTAEALALEQGEMEPIKEPKKRGRKRKHPLPPLQVQNETAQEAAAMKQRAEPKKRGRKRKHPLPPSQVQDEMNPSNQQSSSSSVSANQAAPDQEEPGEEGLTIVWAKHAPKELLPTTKRPMIRAKSEHPTELPKGAKKAKVSFSPEIAVLELDREGNLKRTDSGSLTPKLVRRHSLEEQQQMEEQIQQIDELFEADDSNDDVFEGNSAVLVSEETHNKETAPLGEAENETTDFPGGTDERLPSAKKMSVEKIGTAEKGTGSVLLDEKGTLEQIPQQLSAGKKKPKRSSTDNSSQGERKKEQVLSEAADSGGKESVENLQKITGEKLLPSNKTSLAKAMVDPSKNGAAPSSSGIPISLPKPKTAPATAKSLLKLPRPVPTRKPPMVLPAPKTPVSVGGGGKLSSFPAVPVPIGKEPVPTASFVKNLALVAGNKIATTQNNNIAGGTPGVKKAVTPVKPEEKKNGAERVQILPKKTKTPNVVVPPTMEKSVAHQVMAAATKITPLSARTPKIPIDQNAAKTTKQLGTVKKSEERGKKLGEKTPMGSATKSNKAAIQGSSNLSGSSKSKLLPVSAPKKIVPDGGGVQPSLEASTTTKNAAVSVADGGSVPPLEEKQTAKESSPLTTSADNKAESMPLSSNSSNDVLGGGTGETPPAAEAKPSQNTAAEPVDLISALEMIRKKKTGALSGAPSKMPQKKQKGTFSEKNSTEPASSLPLSLSELKTQIPQPVPLGQKSSALPRKKPALVPASKLPKTTTKTATGNSSVSRRDDLLDSIFSKQDELLDDVYRSQEIRRLELVGAELEKRRKSGVTLGLGPMPNKKPKLVADSSKNPVTPAIQGGNVVIHPLEIETPQELLRKQQQLLKPRSFNSEPVHSGKEEKLGKEKEGQKQMPPKNPSTEVEEKNVNQAPPPPPPRVFRPVAPPPPGTIQNVADPLGLRAELSDLVSLPPPPPPGLPQRARPAVQRREGRTCRVMLREASPKAVGEQQQEMSVPPPPPPKIGSITASNKSNNNSIFLPERQGEREMLPPPPPPSAPKVQLQHQHSNNNNNAAIDNDGGQQSLPPPPPPKARPPVPPQILASASARQSETKLNNPNLLALAVAPFATFSFAQKGTENQKQLLDPRLLAKEKRDSLNSSPVPQAPTEILEEKEQKLSVKKKKGQIVSSDAIPQAIQHQKKTSASALEGLPQPAIRLSHLLNDDVDDDEDNNDRNGEENEEKMGMEKNRKMQDLSALVSAPTAPTPQKAFEGEDHGEHFDIDAMLDDPVDDEQLAEAIIAAQGRSSRSVSGRTSRSSGGKIVEVEEGKNHRRHHKSKEREKSRRRRESEEEEDSDKEEEEDEWMEAPPMNRRNREKTKSEKSGSATKKGKKREHRESEEEEEKSDSEEEEEKREHHYRRHTLSSSAKSKRERDSTPQQYRFHNYRRHGTESHFGGSHLNFGGPRGGRVDKFSRQHHHGYQMSPIRSPFFHNQRGQQIRFGGGRDSWQQRGNRRESTAVNQLAHYSGSNHRRGPWDGQRTHHSHHKSRRFSSRSPSPPRRPSSSRSSHHSQHKGEDRDEDDHEGNEREENFKAEQHQKPSTSAAASSSGGNAGEGDAGERVEERGVVTGGSSMLNEDTTEDEEQQSSTSRDHTGNGSGIEEDGGPPETVA